MSSNEEVSQISTDYLVVGAGIAGLAFVDELLTRTAATVTITDRRDAPGGHWNDAYPFVRLHGPSTLYGVESKELSDFHIEEQGLNKGLMSLATGPEILSYCSKLMRDRFLASGRVTFLPSTEYVESEGIVRNLLSANKRTVNVRRVVHAGWFENVIPATHTRSFSTAPSVTCIAPNSLPKLARNFQNFTVLGAGKTGVDTCVWLLTNGVDPRQIRWIIPNDYWYMNREKAQNGIEFFEGTFSGFIDRYDAIAKAVDAVDFAHRMEKSEIWFRLTGEIEPPHYHGALISRGELSEVRRIEDVVRKGYVASIDTDQVVLTQGTVPARPNTLYIDCTASAIPERPSVPIWQSNKITLQLLRSVMAPFSAALIAFIESLDLSDEERNDLAKPMRFAKTLDSYMLELAEDFRNRLLLTMNPDTRRWSRQSRLDSYTRLAASVPRDDVEKQAVLKRLGEAVRAAAENIPRLAASVTTAKRASHL
ncbi:FAD-dependent pyridine nucleotide-disulfide oxidoreductase [Sarocladium implicatum]|nr:FAD-dependent pyridine nucleotide-disulfide oxidoreductase [Sarocladium implicatum]